MRQTAVFVSIFAGGAILMMLCYLTAAVVALEAVK
jgi:hypothetical protein